MIIVHRLIITRLFGRDLRLETLRLILRIIQFAEAIGQLPPAHKKLKSVGDKGIIVIASRQGETSVG